MSPINPASTLLSEAPKWELGPHADRESSPTEWIPAEVPGAVQLDWAREHEWDDPFFADNFRDYEWMEDRYWTYRCVVPSHPDQCPNDHTLWLRCDGVDYACHVLLAGRVIYTHEGMFTPFSINLEESHAEPGQTLEIRIHPVPKSTPTNDAGREQANRCCKPAVSYGWDFHPRLVPLGLWQVAIMEWRPPLHFSEISLHPVVSDDLKSARLKIEGLYHGHPDGYLALNLTDPAGKHIHEERIKLDPSGSFRAQLTVCKPELWWPHDHGNQPLYCVVLTLHDIKDEPSDTAKRSVGFRRVRLVANEDNQRASDDPPLTRDYPPMTLEINGRRIFIKGSNWVPPDVFPCRVTPETVQPLIDFAKNAHLNLLRCWGGGLINPNFFYDLCDQAGLLIWTEFPLACNNYPDDPAYLAVLDQESKSILKRVRSHACQALWCGGNELFNAWSGMNDQSLALRLLARNCFDFDPYTPFLQTSPVYGVAHGYYGVEIAQSGREAIEVFQERRHTAYTEFGMPGPGSLEILRSFIPESELYPPRPGTAWETHHAFQAWDMDTDSWLGLLTLQRYTGPHHFIEELVANGQLLQAEGYRHLYEEVRRQKPRASMALNWCFNEPWPCAANNSLISYNGVPKPALRAVADSCRPALASAQIPRLLWEPGDTFKCTLWLLNDVYEKLSATSIQAILEVDYRSEVLTEWMCPGADVNRNNKGPECNVGLPQTSESRVFHFHLKSKEYPELNSTYTLFFNLDREDNPLITP